MGICFDGSSTTAPWRPACPAPLDAPSPFWLPPESRWAPPSSRPRPRHPPMPSRPRSPASPPSPRPSARKPASPAPPGTPTQVRQGRRLRTTAPSPAPSWNALTKVTKRFGGSVRLQAMPGTLTQDDRRWPGDLRRRLPLLARLQRPQRQHLLLPHRRPLHQHRRDLVRQLRGRTVLGTRAGTSFPGNDYGIVRYTSTAAQPGAVHLYSGTRGHHRPPATPTVGQAVQRSGSTTGVRSGSVTGSNATVNYAAGHRLRPDPDQRLRRARRQRRLALRRHHRARPDLRRQRQLHAPAARRSSSR